MHRPAPSAQQVTVIDVTTGEPLRRWSLDARELVASGQCVYPNAAQDATPVPAPEPVPVVAVTTATPAEKTPTRRTKKAA